MGSQQSQSFQATAQDIMKMMQKSQYETSRIVVAIDVSVFNSVKASGSNCSLHLTKGLTQYSLILKFLQLCIPLVTRDLSIDVVAFDEKLVFEKTVPLSKLQQTYGEIFAQFEAKRQDNALFAQSLAKKVTFAPAIYRAVEMCVETQAQLLVFILSPGNCSDLSLERQAIREASMFPIHHVFLPVGGADFTQIEVVANQNALRKFDNFHFCDLAEFFETDESRCGEQIERLIQLNLDDKILQFQGENTNEAMKRVEKFAVLLFRDLPSRQAQINSQAMLGVFEK